MDSGPENERKYFFSKTSKILFKNINAKLNGQGHLVFKNWDCNVHVVDDVKSQT